METAVYVDVLLVLNYVINMLLIIGMCKCAGRSPARRRIVAAALVGSAGSLTIFLPFQGFWTPFLTKILVSALIVRIACRYINLRAFLKEWFLFFAVSFFFAGVMLGIWLAFSPRGMLYYNGVVYFDVSSLALVVTTTAAYLLLSLGSRIARAGRLQKPLYQVRIRYRGKEAVVTGLMDTGNHLTEPFSGIPVMVCGLGELEPLLPRETVRAISSGEVLQGKEAGIPLRLIPYSGAESAGVLPAFRPDELLLEREGELFLAERAYVGISSRKIGDGSYNAILNPDLAGIKTANGGGVRQ